MKRIEDVNDYIQYLKIAIKSLGDEPSLSDLECLGLLNPKFRVERNMLCKAERSPTHKLFSIRFDSADVLYSEEIIMYSTPHCTHRINTTSTEDDVAKFFSTNPDAVIEYRTIISLNEICAAFSHYKGKMIND